MDQDERCHGSLSSWTLTATTPPLYPAVPEVGEARRVKCSDSWGDLLVLVTSQHPTQQCFQGAAKNPQG